MWGGWLIALYSVWSVNLIWCYIFSLWSVDTFVCYIRDRPFKLKGGLWFFVSFGNFFSDNTRVRILFFLSHEAQFFFQNLTLGYMTKTLNQIFFFILHRNQNIFFSYIGNQNILLEKNHNPPLHVKWSFPKYLIENLYQICPCGLLSCTIQWD